MESQELPEPGAQFKCLLYAEPVFGDNGPFELLVNYDRKQLARMQVSDPKELGPGGRSRSPRRKAFKFAFGTYLHMLTALLHTSQ